MQKVLVLKGRLISETDVRLEQPVTGVLPAVEVIAYGEIKQTQHAAGSLADLIRSFPPGTRSKEDIDRQIAEERDWGERDATLP